MKGEKRIQIQMANRSHQLTCFFLPVPRNPHLCAYDGTREVLLLLFKPWVGLEKCGRLDVSPLAQIDPPVEGDERLGKHKGLGDFLLALGGGNRGTRNVRGFPKSD